MKSSLAFILLLLHLHTNTELLQVFRLPKLISHYFQHHRQDPTVGFSKFLVMHYGGNDGTTADDDTDNQLPFHNPVRPCPSVVYFPLVQDPFVLDLPQMIIIKHYNYIHSSKTSGHFSRLFRPPQFS